MITIDSAISTAEELPVRADTHALVALNKLLVFEETYRTNDLEDYAQHANIYSKYATAWKWGAYKGFEAFDPEAGATYDRNAPGVIDLSDYDAGHGVRMGVMREGTADYVYSTWMEAGADEGSGVQLKRICLQTGVEELLGDPFGDPRPLVQGDVYEITSCVIPLTSGVYVITSQHDYAAQRATIKAWRYDRANETVSGLDVFHQADTSDTDLIDANLFQGYYTQFCCGADFNGAEHIVINIHAGGKPMLFTYANGAASALRDILLLDPDTGHCGFTPNSLIEVNGWLYLAGRMTYTWEDASTTAYDCYLISADGENWSVGEYSSIICAENVKGSWVLDEDADPAVLYYVGMLVGYKATLTPAHGYNETDATQALDLSSRMGDYTLKRRSNNAAGFNIPLNNTDGALIEHAVLRSGALLQLYSGQEGTHEQIITLDVDSISTDADDTGYKPAQVTAIDAANKALLDYGAPIDLQWRGQAALESDLSTLDGLIVKSPPEHVAIIEDDTSEDARAIDHLLTADGLQSKGICTPLFMYADVHEHADILQKVTLEFVDTGSDKSLRLAGLLFGGTDDGEYYGVTLPSEGSWNPQTAPRVFASPMGAWEGTDGIGRWYMERRNTMLMEGATALFDVCAEGTDGAYTTDGTWAGAEGTEYDVAARAYDNRLQLFIKTRVYTPAGASAAAGYELITDWSFNADKRIQWADRMRPGIAVGTDTWHSKEAFADAPVGDMVLQLTSAQELNIGNGDHNVVLGTGTAATHPDASQTITSVTFTSGMYAWMRNGMSVRCVNGGRDQRYKVTSFTANSITVDAAVNITAPQDPATTIYIPSEQEIYAEANSGYTKLSTSGATAYLEPGAKQHNLALKGRGAFFADSGAAISMRLIASNGVRHELYDGAYTQGWDATNPIADGTYFYSGSDPSAWRLAFSHGWMFDGSGSEIGLDDTGYMWVDDELVRYTPVSAQWRSDLANETVWSIVPAYYSYIEVHAQNSGGITAVRNALVGSYMPGDDFDDVPDAVGLSVRIISTENNADSEPEVGDTMRVTEAGDHSGQGYISISPPYQFSITAPVVGKSADLAVLSGRAQLDTDRARHAKDAPVVLCPVPYGGTLYDSLINVPHYAVYSGAVRTVEDALRSLCAWAGVRNVEFRNYMTGASHDAVHSEVWYVAGGARELPLIGDVADFMLVMTVAAVPSGYLRVRFRDYYDLCIGDGVIGLQTTSTDVDAYGGERWLEWAPLPQFDLSSYDLRVSAVEHRICVEINGQLAWEFDTRRFTDGTNSYDVRTAAPIYVVLDNAPFPGTTSVGIWAQELWQPITSYVVAQGDSVMDVINDLCKRYQISTRPTPDGGILFSRFNARAVVDVIENHLKRHARGTDGSGIVTHVQISGQRSSAYVDVTAAKQHGYKYRNVRMSDVASSQDALDAAALLVGNGVEYATQERIAARGRIAHEVEDVLPVRYMPTAGVTIGATETVWVNAGLPWVPTYETTSSEGSPTAPYTEGSYVITGLDWKTRNGVLYADYLLRNYEG